MLDIVRLVDESKAKKRKVYPCHVNRASNLGHPCIRHLVYCRTNWNDQALYDLGLQYIFDEGNRHHKAVFDDLREAGITVVEQERPLAWPEFQITGHQDAKIQDGNTLVPVEVKSVEPNAWKKMNSIQDMMDSNKLWWRKYPAQLTLYVKMDKKDIGLFILKNKLTGRLKQIEYPLDLSYVGELTEKASIINQHIAQGTFPDKIEPDEDICGYCGFNVLCLPDRDFGDPLQILEDAQLVSILSRREELKEAYKEYNALQKQLKRELNGKNNIVLESGGVSWHISGKITHRNGYDVKPCDYWLAKAVRLKA